MRVILWLRAMRAPFFSASIIPVLVGTALAFHEGHFKWINLVYSLIIAISGHAGANMLNDYYDAHGSDPVNKNITPFSGGSRLIQEGLLSRLSFLRAAVIAYSISFLFIIWASIIYLSLWILIVGFLGIGLGIVYSVRWTNGMGRGWGELAVGMAFGPVTVLGSYLIQANQLSLAAVFAGVPVAFLIMGVLLLNEIPDVVADQKVGKWNWMARTGDMRKGVWIYLGLIFFAYLAVVIAVVSRILPGHILISCFSIPLAVWIGLKLLQHKITTPEIIPVMAGNIGLHLLTGILLSIGLCWF